MDIATYEELLGITVEAEDIAATTAQIKRTRRILEGMLGYTLDKKKASYNEYAELGKAKADQGITGIIGDIDNIELDPADEVIGSYRIFPYHAADKFFMVDPYTQVHKVKLVYLKTGDEPNGITHRTFLSGQVGVHKNGKISKYIERCKTCYCACGCEGCVQLAVDADWLNENCLPEELLYVWADMVEYWNNPQRGVVEETLGTHRYKLESVDAPENLPENIAIIKKYAGPNGTVANTITI